MFHPRLVGETKDTTAQEHNEKAAEVMALQTWGTHTSAANISGGAISSFSEKAEMKLVFCCLGICFSISLLAEHVQMTRTCAVSSNVPMHDARQSTPPNLGR